MISYTILQTPLGIRYILSQYAPSEWRLLLQYAAVLDCDRSVSNGHVIHTWISQRARSHHLCSLSFLNLLSYWVAWMNGPGQSQGKHCAGTLLTLWLSSSFTRGRFGLFSYGKSLILLRPIALADLHQLLSQLLVILSILIGDAGTLYVQSFVMNLKKGHHVLFLISNYLSLFIEQWGKCMNGRECSPSRESETAFQALPVVSKDHCHLAILGTLKS